MCYHDDFDGHKTQHCTVGDLLPGQQYRTPGGHNILVLDLPSGAADVMNVTDTATGRVTEVRRDVKLGHDRAGRLYASRSLNPTTAAPADAPQAKDPPATDTSFGVTQA